jgi:hypothetical protein
MKTNLILICLLPTLLFGQTFKTGNDVISAMYKKYEGGKKWYKNMTFTQDIFFYKEGKVEKKEVWYEASSSPGNLAIKHDSMSSRNGTVFFNYKVSGIKDGKATEPKPFIHDLCLMGFDVYFLKPEVCAHYLDSLGYNLKLIREDMFEGRKVFVIGAAKGDTTSNQVWIDAERLYMHRIIYTKRKNTQDVVFANYEWMNNYWVAKGVKFRVNGVLEAEEKYYDIKFPKTLDPSIFDPTKFSESKW